MLRSAIRIGKEWILSLLRLFIPRLCVVCDTPLQEGEECLCLKCNIDMPRTNYHLDTENPVERMFWGKIPIERASSYFYYHRGSDFSRIIHKLKYEGRKDLAETMGRFMAAELAPSGFFYGIDAIVPVPLHPRRLKARGYNQSERIACGVSAVTGIAVDTTVVVRNKYTETQTRKSTSERWQNTDGIFTLILPGKYTAKHILIIDDVLTTGATATACADAFAQEKGIRISVLGLAMAN